VYGHPDTHPPWWPDDCIRWIDMVDLRGKPPYLPKNMSYTDVLKRAIDNGLKYFGYSCETWVDDQAYSKEVVTSFTARQNKPNIQTMKFDSLPKLPIPINKMNCSIARTSLARLLRFHCGTNPKYGDVASMPVWWPNDSFEWAKLKNLSHRFEGFMGDSYSNCLRLAVICGYEFYGKDPVTFVEDPGEDLPSVSNSNRRVSIDNNMSDLVKKLDGVIDSNIELYKVNQFEQNNFTFDTHKIEANYYDPVNGIQKDPLTPVSPPAPTAKRKRPPPPLLPISAVKSFAETGSADASLLKDLGVAASLNNGVKVSRTSES